jgi:hypothetical protein
VDHVPHVVKDGYGDLLMTSHSSPERSATLSAQPDAQFTINDLKIHAVRSRARGLATRIESFLNGSALIFLVLL